MSEAPLCREHLDAIHWNNDTKSYADRGLIETPGPLFLVLTVLYLALTVLYLAVTVLYLALTVSCGLDCLISGPDCRVCAEFARQRDWKKKHQVLRRLRPHRDARSLNKRFPLLLGKLPTKTKVESVSSQTRRGTSVKWRTPLWGLGTFT